jgi:MoaA/NifB/PqqE/SkfB family radical SAM enzyme
MSNSFKGFNFYKSTFDTETGVLVRDVEASDFEEDYGRRMRTPLTNSWAKENGFESPGRWEWNRDPEVEKFALAWARKFGRVTRRTEKGDNGEKQVKFWERISDLRRYHAFSPVPETIDVKITNWCNFGCSYCYMDSTTKGDHASKDLLIQIFKGLKEAPYQIAFGGGEPTAHPEFPWFLEYTRSKGTVPNYTTAGHILRDNVFEATNKYCGGVALTYHAFKGPEYFKKTYDTWRSRLDARVQLNVHVLFDKDVADNLLDLQDIGLKNLNIVLLAYYPNVGRANWESIPSKGVYEVTLPAALKTVESSGFKIAFSEGLLPYFLSHQFPEVPTQFASQQEGLYSCYVDDKGRVSQSSFAPPEEKTEDWQPDNSIFEKRFQLIWNKLNKTLTEDDYSRHFDACDRCSFAEQCNIPSTAHFLLCKFAEHNIKMPQRIPERKKRLTVVSE